MVVDYRLLQKNDRLVTHCYKIRNKICVYKVVFMNRYKLWLHVSATFIHYRVDSDFLITNTIITMDIFLSRGVSTRFGVMASSYGAWRSHSGTPHSVGLLWTIDQSDAETSTWQHTELTRDGHPAFGGIRTRKPSTIHLYLQPHSIYLKYRNTCDWLDNSQFQM
jgi:hypothetical protein